MASAALSPEQLQEDKGPLTLIVLWALTAVTAVIILIRIYIRQWMLRNQGLDDWLIAVSVIFGLAFCALMTASVHYGYGKHTAALEVPAAETALMWNMAAFIVGLVSFALSKLGVAALLDRVMNPSGLQRCIVWGLAGLVAAVNLVNIVIYVTMCEPREALWEFHIVMEGKATCRDVWILVNFATFNGAISAFTDLYLATYPAFVVFRLQMPLRKKIGLTVALGLGYIAAAMAIVKCTQLKGLANKTDSTYETVPLVIWTSVEADVVAIAASIPTLHPLLKWIMGKRAFTSDNMASYSNRQRGYGGLYDKDTASRAKRSQTRTTAYGLQSHDSSGLRDVENESQKNFIRRTDDVQVEYEMPTRSPAKPFG